jgi:uncharacterized SAM-binding protein YcdF (DUF218 family)
LDAIVLEERSRSSYENAVYSVELMQKRGLNHALLVTSALHMPRSQALMRAAGVDFVPVATDFEVLDWENTLISWLPSSQARSGRIVDTTYFLPDWAD